MDAAARTADRLASASQDPADRARAAVEAARRQEVAVGVLVQLDASRAPDGWRLPYRRFGPCPKKLTGTWEVTGSTPSGGLSLARVSKKGTATARKIANLEWVSAEALARILVAVLPPAPAALEAPPEVEAPDPSWPKARRFSMAGPCLSEGRVERETPRFYVVVREANGRQGWERARLAKGPVHTEPCRRCRDHPETSYPLGYMD